MNTEFSNLYSHGFVRVAACVPVVRVGDPAFNAEKSLDLLRKAHGQKAVLAVFPELGISAYSCDDLFFQDAIQNTALEGLGRILDSSAEMSIEAVVGLPLKIRDALFNCAAVLFRGKILGIAVKSFLPNYREFYEMRHFKPSSDLPVDSLDILGQKDIPLGADLIFEADDIQDFRLFCEICEDLWTPVPALMPCSSPRRDRYRNPSASNVTIGKADYRRSLVSNQSARCIAAYVYAGAGPESPPRTSHGTATQWLAER